MRAGVAAVLAVHGAHVPWRRVLPRGARVAARGLSTGAAREAQEKAAAQPVSPHGEGDPGDAASRPRPANGAPGAGADAGNAAPGPDAQASSGAGNTAQKGKDVAAAEAPRASLPVRVWHKVKEEAVHYWNGSKLLGKEMRISTRLMRRLILGYGLTRREQRQLRRTMGDLLRLIPFIPFVIIPMAEVLLPVALRLFPNMLPSTFESKFAAEEKRRRLLKLRIEMAKFLQESIKEGGLQLTASVKDSDAFKEFFRKVRTTGESPTPEDVILVAKLFNDDLTLDNLTRPQLVSICRYMQQNAFGTDNYLRFQIRHALSRIRRDDLVINEEGIGSLTKHELVSACQSRGIWTHNMTEEQLRESLGAWINLHFKQKISGTLLILSRAFYFVNEPTQLTSPQSFEDKQLKSLELTMSSLPETLLNEAELHFSKQAASTKKRLDVLEEQEHLIEDEAEQEEQHQAVFEEEKKKRRDTEDAQAAKIVPQQANGPKTEPADDARMTREQLSELGEALSILSAKSSVLRERQQLAQLMKELPHDGDAASEPDDADKTDQPTYSPTTKALYKRIRSMLERIDKQLEDYDHDVGTRMHLIETSSTGKVSSADLEQALRLIKHRPGDETLHQLVEKLDVDLDGLIPLEHVLELAREDEFGSDDAALELKKEGQQLREQKPRMRDIMEQ
ncbi:LETM1 domain-containing protein ylh47 [Malassezia sp. CBS 17886]|nr:LETM1 domain-containing protein ylh47 [Malassezia sp. CBS 17886]